jgi:hypothetical protein
MRDATECDPAPPAEDDSRTIRLDPRKRVIDALASAVRDAVTIGDTALLKIASHALMELAGALPGDVAKVIDLTQQRRHRRE